MRPAAPDDELVHCEHAARCGGCPLIALPYSAQLEHKRARVTTALVRYPLCAGVAVAATLGADAPTAYRTREKLVVAPGPRIGLYAGPAHEVVDIPHCRVMTPRLAATTAALRELCAERPTAAGSALEPYGKRGRGALLGVDLREVEGPLPGILVTLIVARERAPGQKAALAAAAALMAKAPDVLGVSLSRRAVHAPRLLGDAPEHLAGSERVRDEIGGVALFATAGAFVQAHRAQAARLATRVVAGLESALGTLAERHVLELFAGSGALGLALARAGARVTLVEAHGPAAETARAAAELVAPGRVTVLGSLASEALVRFAHEKRHFDAVLVDPPRRGLAPELRAALAALEPRALAYVSCEPGTLARDLAALAWLGLATDRVEPLDMIPLSDEVESLAILRPAPLPLPTVLAAEGDLVAVDKPPHLPTTPQGEHLHSLLARVRALPGCAGAVPLHRLDIGTSGVCLFARHASGAGALAKAFGDARSQKTYVALVQGITHDHGTVRRDLEDEGQLRTAVTRYRRREVVAGQSLLDLEPEEGRRHQLRRHLAAIGHPVVGDERFGHPATNRHFAARHGLDRTFLHCARIALVTPAGRELVLESALAPDLAAILGQCRSEGDAAPAGASAQAEPAPTG